MTASECFDQPTASGSVVGSGEGSGSKVLNREVLNRAFVLRAGLSSSDFPSDDPADLEVIAMPAAMVINKQRPASARAMTNGVRRLTEAWGEEVRICKRSFLRWDSV